MVPSSRAVTFVRQLAAQPAGTVSGRLPTRAGRACCSACCGNRWWRATAAYTDTPPGKAPLQLRAWYLHIDGGGQLERHFNDPDAYKPYRLPPDGKLERDATPSWCSTTARACGWAPWRGNTGTWCASWMGCNMADATMPRRWPRRLGAALLAAAPTLGWAACAPIDTPFGAEPAAVALRPSRWRWRWTVRASCWACMANACRPTPG
ncbi:hypothetical protein WJ972_19455 [Achromobacter insuavis]